MSEYSELVARIALTMIPGVGPVIARHLISYCDNAESIFKQPPTSLTKIPEIGPVTAAAIRKRGIQAKAEKEAEFVLKNELKPLFYTDKDYPNRLRHCNDAPMLLYFKGEFDFNACRTVGIVGTRQSTEYGRDITKQLIEGLSPYHVAIISGLAYGIDICAHRECVRQGIPTVGVMAHGHDDVYPPEHRSTAMKMLKNGGLLTEYKSRTRPEKENFPTRNRIVAGLCDAIIVVEAAVKGGALITADLAAGYNRDVFAVPGNIGLPYSEGCNSLIRENKAALITSANDIAYMMGWSEHPETGNSSVQKTMFIELTDDEQKLTALLSSREMFLDELVMGSRLSFSSVASVLLSLEMKGVIKALPGKRFKLL